MLAEASRLYGITYAYGFFPMKLSPLPSFNMGAILEANTSRCIHLGRFGTNSLVNTFLLNDPTHRVWTGI